MTSIYKTSTPEPVGMGHQGPRRGPAQQADEEGEDIILIPLYLKKLMRLPN